MKGFVLNFLRSLHPRYFIDLYDEGLKKAWRHFVGVIALSFVLMFVVALPIFFIVSNELNNAVLDIAEFSVNSNLDTVKPVSIPSYDPFITIDTTGQKELSGEEIFVTDKSLSLNMFGVKKELPLESYSLDDDRNGAKDFAFYILIFLLPSIIFYLWLIFMAKYLFIILILSCAGYVVLKGMKRVVEFKNIFALGLFTCTLMVFIEILSIPFGLGKILLTYEPVNGIGFSLIALTLYLVYFVIAIRLNTNPNIDR